jgi:hypothetical protein
MEVMELDFYACITSHIYFKLFFVLIFGIIITFADEIEILKNKISLYLILFVFLSTVLTHMDNYGYGVIMLLMILFIITYNIQLNNKDFKKITHQNG